MRLLAPLLIGAAVGLGTMFPSVVVEAGAGLLVVAVGFGLVCFGDWK